MQQTVAQHSTASSPSRSRRLGSRHRLRRRGRRGGPRLARHPACVLGAAVAGVSSVKTHTPDRERGGLGVGAASGEQWGRHLGRPWRRSRQAAASTRGGDRCRPPTATRGAGAPSRGARRIARAARAPTAPPAGYRGAGVTCSRRSLKAAGEPPAGQLSGQRASHCTLRPFGAGDVEKRAALRTARRHHWLLHQRRGRRSTRSSRRPVPARAPIHPALAHEPGCTVLSVVGAGNRRLASCRRRTSPRAAGAPRRRAATASP